MSRAGNEPWETARSLLPPELERLRPGELLVSETFLSIQGESTHAGRPCFFVRLAGCHLRCTWCDTAYAFSGGERVTVDECLERAAASGARLVEVTGGEPLLQESVYPLLGGLLARGHEVLLETAGALPLDRVPRGVRRIADWKCPGSGMDHHNRPALLGELRPGDELKLVILDRRDYQWARGWLEGAAREQPLLGSSIPIHFSPAHGRLEPAALARWILEDRLDVRLHLQLHKLLWPGEARGV